MVHDSMGSTPAAWGGRTAGEIRAVAGEDGSILVVPVGSVEQHGDHLPVATDTILVDAVVRSGVERAGDLPILVAPPFWAGYSPHHLPFGGTLTLSFDTMLSAIEELADAALENGFDALVLVNGHGGNDPLVSAATATIGEAHPDREVVGLTYFDLAEPFAQEIRDSEEGGMAHGGEFETSLMSYLRPDLVGDPDDPPPNLDEPYDRSVRDLLSAGPVSVYRDFDEYSETGAIGDPSVASAEKGEQLYDLLGEELGDLFEAVHAEAPD